MEHVRVLILIVHTFAGVFVW